MRLFIALFFVVIAFHTQAQNDAVLIDRDNQSTEDYNAPNDSSLLTKKEFQSSTLEKLKADPALQYQQPPTVAESLWDRIKMWLIIFFSSLIEGATMTTVGRILLYTAGLILIIVIVLTLLRVNAFRVLYSGADQNKMGYQVFHENIHEMDFEKLIHEASEKNDFRLGTRLILLYSLKLLSDQHLIQWEAGKTNHDYVNELSAPELKTGLNEISFYFDYAWYGNFQLDAAMFGKVQATFSGWRQKLKA